VKGILIEAGEGFVTVVIRVKMCCWWRQQDRESAPTGLIRKWEAHSLSSEVRNNHDDTDDILWYGRAVSRHNTTHDAVCSIL